MTKDEIELSNQAFARAWYIETPLIWLGVDLGDSLTYDILNVLGSIWKRYWDALPVTESKPEEMNSG